MTLGFSTKWPKQMGELAGQPNYFIEKIWASLLDNGISNENAYQNYLLSYKYQFSKSLWHGSFSRNELPKLYTIRAGSRWRKGMKIHLVINNRTKNRFQFAPILECKSVQEIEIVSKTVFVHNGKNLLNPLTYKETEVLAINDGFPSVEAFFRYFNTDFKGQLIHWTDLRY